MQGSMKTVVDCLLALRAEYSPTVAGDNNSLMGSTAKPESPHGEASANACISPLSGEERRKVLSESKFQRALRSPIMSGRILLFLS